MKTTDLFKEYLTLTRKYKDINNYLDNSDMFNKEGITSLNDAVVDNLKAYYKFKIGKEFDSMSLMAEKIEGAM